MLSRLVSSVVVISADEMGEQIKDAQNSGISLLRVVSAASSESSTAVEGPTYLPSSSERLLTSPPCTLDDVGSSSGSEASVSASDAPRTNPSSARRAGPTASVLPRSSQSSRVGSAAVGVERESEPWRRAAPRSSCLRCSSRRGCCFDQECCERVRAIRVVDGPEKIGGPQRRGLALHGPAEIGVPDAAAKLPGKLVCMRAGCGERRCPENQDAESSHARCVVG